jgi:hypothetical protein
LPEVALPELEPDVLVFPGEEAAEDIVARGWEWFLGRKLGVDDLLGGCEELLPLGGVEIREGDFV